MTSDLLGFDGPTGNTYGSIATVDYLLESASAAAVVTAGLGRFVQDLLVWCTPEFRYLRLADGFVRELRGLIGGSAAAEAGSAALSDFTATGLSQSDLDKVLARLK